MKVGGCVHGIVAYLNCFAASATPADAYDGSVTYTHDGSARGCSVINPGVGPDSTVDGMAPVKGISGRNPGELERSLEEGLSHALSLFIPVGISSVSLVKIDCGKAGAVPQEFGIGHPLNAHGFTLADIFRVQKPEAVSLLKAEEVHGPGVDVGKVRNKFRSSPRSCHVIP